MAVLTEAELKGVAKKMMQEYSIEREQIPITKQQFIDMLEDIDIGINTDRVRMNNYIDSTIRTALSTGLPADKDKKLKALAMINILEKRYEVDA